MSRLLSQAVCLITTLSAFQFIALEAYCPRCVKIEAERAQEQAENPQPSEYYDDHLRIQQEKSQQAPEKK